MNHFVWYSAYDVARVTTCLLWSWWQGQPGIDLFFFLCDADGWLLICLLVWNIDIKIQIRQCIHIIYYILPRYIPLNTQYGLADVVQPLEWVWPHVVDRMWTAYSCILGCRWVRSNVDCGFVFLSWFLGLFSVYRYQLSCARLVGSSHLCISVYRVVILSTSAQYFSIESLEL